MEHGQGYRRYGANQCEYSGEWQAGLRHGKGQYLDRRTGASYNGEYVADRKHGQGEERLPGISTKVGLWANDLLNGYGRLIEHSSGTGGVGIDYKG